MRNSGAQDSQAVGICGILGGAETGRFPKETPTIPMNSGVSDVNWRRGGDLNPRYQFKPVRRFSKPLLSTAQPPLRNGESVNRTPVAFRVIPPQAENATTYLAPAWARSRGNRSATSPYYFILNDL